MRSRTWTILILGAVAGSTGCDDACAPPEARGGTDAEQEAAELEAEAFLDGMRDTVCVPRIRLGNLRGTSIGKYTPGTQRIKVQKDRPLDEVRSTVRHELCHALQFQQELDLSGPEWKLALPIDLPADERPGETWAYTCQQGPKSAYLMGDTCPGDPFGTSIFETVRDAFVQPPTMQERTVRFDEVGRLVVGEADVTWFPVQGGGLSVEAADSEPATVDLYTGMPVPPAPPLEQDGGGARLYYFSAFAANGARGLRLVYEDEQGTTRAGCLRDRETPFASDGAVWSAYRDGPDLVWGVWSAR